MLLGELLGHVVPVPGHRPVIISFLGEKQGNVLTMPGNRHLIISILGEKKTTTWEPFKIVDIVFLLQAKISAKNINKGNLLMV